MSRQVNGERLKMVREIAGFSPVELSRIVGIPTRDLLYFEAEKRIPKAEQLCSISLATGFPVAFFRLGPPPAFSLGSLIFHNSQGAQLPEPATKESNGFNGGTP